MKGKKCDEAILKAEYKEYFPKWEDRWKKVVTSRGQYFKGDIVVIDHNWFFRQIQRKDPYFSGRPSKNSFKS